MHACTLPGAPWNEANIGRPTRGGQTILGKGKSIVHDGVITVVKVRLSWHFWLVQKKEGASEGPG